MVEKFFTDEELVAYLDGESDFAPVEEIEAALKTDRALIKRVGQLEIDRESIVQGFNHIKPAKPINPAILEAPANQNSASSWRLAASVAVVCLAIGFGSSTLLTKSDEPGWIEYVAAYQALYTNSTLSSVNQSEEALVTELQRVSSAIGKDIKLEQLNVTEEVEYKRGQVLGFRGKALIQLAFLTSMGEPMALCILRTGKADSESVSVATLEGMSSAQWTENGYSFLLIGGKDEALVSRLAEKYLTASL
ncbi:MAG: hypothetical protein QNJ29_12890 [Rhizobiaceae bacterium]|nr:hypothetical protein [Rhizobiaceae bacterium]